MTSVRIEWGLAGLEALIPQVSVLIIVDVLSFSTAVDIAAARGAMVLPFAPGDRAAAEAAANAAGAVLARPRRTGAGAFSLSPASLTTIAAGTRLLLPSPNGSRLSLAGLDRPVLTGCFRNAAAIATAARILAAGGVVGVIPAGECWADGSLRPAIEDWLGAGAIIDQLALAGSAEATVARDAYRSATRELPALIRGSTSGRELIDAGFAADVDLALALNASGCAPRLIDGAYRAG